MVKYRLREFLKYRRRKQSRLKKQNTGPVLFNKNILVICILSIFLAAGIWQKWRSIVPAGEKRIRVEQAAKNMDKNGTPGKNGKRPEKPIRLAWTMPVKNSVILKTFGWHENRKTGEWHFHPGVDLKTARDEPVCAALQGKVTEINLDAQGWRVVVEHSPGLKSVYKYLGSLESGCGDEVKTGQILGYYGKKYQEEQGLHLEIHQNGKPIDPAGLIK